MCFPCEATPRPTRANPAHPRGGGILSFAIAPRAIDATLFCRFDHSGNIALMTSAVNSTTPGPPVRCTPRPGSVGHLEAPPGPGRTPFRGPHDYALRRPDGPPRTFLAALIEATGRWPASRARPTDLTGRTWGGVYRTQSPEGRLLTMDTPIMNWTTLSGRSQAFLGGNLPAPPVHASTSSK